MDKKEQKRLDKIHDFLMTAIEKNNDYLPLDEEIPIYPGFINKNMDLIYITALSYRNRKTVCYYKAVDHQGHEIMVGGHVLNYNILNELFSKLSLDFLKKIGLSRELIDECWDLNDEMYISIGKQVFPLLSINGEFYGLRDIVEDMDDKTFNANRPYFLQTILSEAKNQLSLVDYEYYEYFLNENLDKLSREQLEANLGLVTIGKVLYNNDFEDLSIKRKYSACDTIITDFGIRRKDISDVIGCFGANEIFSSYFIECEQFDFDSYDLIEYDETLEKFHNEHGSTVYDESYTERHPKEDVIELADWLDNEAPYHTAKSVLSSALPRNINGNLYLGDAMVEIISNKNYLPNGIQYYLTKSQADLYNLKVDADSAITIHTKTDDGKTKENVIYQLDRTNLKDVAPAEFSCLKKYFSGLTKSFTIRNTKDLVTFIIEASVNEYMNEYDYDQSLKNDIILSINKSVFQNKDIMDTLSPVLKTYRSLADNEILDICKPINIVLSKNNVSFNQSSEEDVHESSQISQPNEESAGNDLEL